MTIKANKTAVALKYDQKSAPSLVAKGHGELAEAIIKVAEDSGVFIHEDPALSEFLSRLDLGQEIPRELYVVIAELIAFSFVLQGKFPENWTQLSGRVDKTV